jgi:hypothetical protein
MDNGWTHDFNLSTVEKVRKACCTLGYADTDSLEAFSFKLEDHILFMCRAVEAMREQRVVIDGGMRIFRVRHKVTGLFRKAGSHDAWGKEGKAWTKAGHVKAHLNLHKRYVRDPASRCGDYKYVPEVDDWEVLEYRPDQIIVRTVRDFHPD